MTSATELASGLRTTVNRLAHQLRTPAARHGITPTRLSAMATLDKLGPLRPGVLADALSIRAASMTRLAEALEEGGWVRRTADPADQRACLLSLTDEGVSAMQRLRREGVEELAADILSLSAEDRAVLVKALPVLAQLADRHRRPE